MGDIRSKEILFLTTLMLVPAVSGAQATAPSAVGVTTAPAPATLDVSPAPASVSASAQDSMPASVSKGSWFDWVKASAFIDAYYSINVLDIDSPTATVNGYPRAFDTTNGFALSWFGADVSYDPGGALGPVGVTLSLRAGATAVTLAGSDAAINFAPLAQAFITLKAAGSLSFDFGKFGTIFGAEVAESWNNPNYTRGAVYNLLQPFFHTGLRINWQPTEQLAVKLIAVNGYNNTQDNNEMKTFGLQLGYNVGPFGLTIGYLVGPEQDNNNADLRHLIDAIITFSPTEKLAISINGDLVMEQIGDDTQMAFGVMGSAHAQLSNVWGVGLRGELVSDPNGYISSVVEQNLITGTLSIDAAIGKYALVRLDTRVDYVTEGTFATGDEAQLTAALGMVVKTD